MNPRTSVRAIQADVNNEDPDIIDARHISEVDDGQILLDSGASAHVSGNSPFLCDIEILKQPIPLLLADPKTVVRATRRGKLCIPVKEGIINVDNVYVCNAISGTLLSLGRLLCSNYQAQFSGTVLKIISPSSNVYNTRFNNFCWYIEPRKTISAISSAPLHTSFTWHCRLGHASDDRVKTFLKRFVPAFDIKTWKPFFCDQCAKSKGALRRPDLGKSIVKYDEVLDLVVSDVVGPFTAPDTTMRYFVTLRDHKSTFVLSKPIVSRSDVVPTLKQWLEFFKTNKGSYPKFLRTDNAKEYVSAALTNFCSERGIQAVPVVAYTPADNGEAERLNRTIGETARTMLHSSNLPEKFWPYAYQVATYLHNRLPNKRTKDSTPLEAMFNIQPSASTLYQFGTKAIIQIPAPTTPKLEPRAVNAILIGYPPSGRGWIFYIPSSRLIVHSTHAVFPETHEAPLIKNEHSDKMKIDNLINSISMTLGQVPTNEIVDQQQSTIENTRMVPDMTLPNNIKHALASKDSTEWLLAANNELKQFDKLNVWTAVDAQLKIKVLGARWVFSLKRDSEGNVIKYKARYVVKGFAQRPGQDFGDCYAPQRLS
ncbi:hypothetical protein O181_016259 [Austropuccinia psidii MF-1]|uniref:Integrase catalytic domain-containing protein n=1 Tax=Austropuccinia psidii MF-1 TaxID=1389203 RepID=A0A9Q3GRM4_9BASI|nr:hypothetical protein [Austropuccinia psidii MF-1]